jgi:hypothetical protein
VASNATSSGWVVEFSEHPQQLVRPSGNPAA